MLVQTKRIDSSEDEWYWVARMVEWVNAQTDLIISAIETSFPVTWCEEISGISGKWYTDALSDVQRMRKDGGVSTMMDGCLLEVNQGSRTIDVSDNAKSI